MWCGFCLLDLFLLFWSCHVLILLYFFCGWKGSVGHVQFWNFIGLVGGGSFLRFIYACLCVCDLFMALIFYSFTLLGTSISLTMYDLLMIFLQASFSILFYGDMLTFIFFFDFWCCIRDLLSVQTWYCNLGSFFVSLHSFVTFSDRKSVV